MSNTSEIGHALANITFQLREVPCPLTRSALVDLDDALLDVDDPRELARFLNDLEHCLRAAPDLPEQASLQALLGVVPQLERPAMAELRGAYRNARKHLLQPEH